MAADYASLSRLGPFALKDELIAVAARAGRRILNAGRGNPNFFAAAPRQAFFRLGAFALQEAERAGFPDGIGGFPQRDGIAARFAAFCAGEGGGLLAAAVACARDRLGLSAAALLHEMTAGILGCAYPEPPRMLPLAETIVGHFLARHLTGGRLPDGGIDIFAVEGVTAGISYVFHALRLNGLLLPGDKIALGTPIFAPYLEMPLLDEFRLVELRVEADPAGGWQYPEAELDKLADSSIKAFVLVNPSNPPSVKIAAAGLAKIGRIVAEQRPDLVILTDEVYGTFAEDFLSLFAVCPRNTVLLYSFSKHFGATGWRLGVVATHRDTILDAKLRASSAARYGSLVLDPSTFKFIDRLVADSRTVALNHTAGLSTPQQVQMALFALFALSEEGDAYKNAIKNIVRRRHGALYRSLGIPAPPDPNGTDYYALLDLEGIATALHGSAFARWLLAEKEPLEVLFRLAEEGVILLPGKGFGAPSPAARISFANLDEKDYATIGQVIRRVADAYYQEFEQAK
jgi:aspartate 4-decarboxylase